MRCVNLQGTAREVIILNNLSFVAEKDLSTLI